MSELLTDSFDGPIGARTYFELVAEDARENAWVLGAARWRAVGCRCVSSGDGRSQRKLAKCAFHGTPAPPRPPAITYDAETDILYLPIAAPQGLVHSVETTWLALVDRDEADTVVGVELWSASERVPGALLAELERAAR